MTKNIVKIQGVVDEKDATQYVGKWDENKYYGGWKEDFSFVTFEEII